MNRKMYLILILFCVGVAEQLRAQLDTVVVNTYEYTIKDQNGKKSLWLKINSDSVLNGQYRVMKTNSWHEDMFLVDNMLHGKNFIYYVNRCTQERNYRNGNLDGKQYVYHSEKNMVYRVDTYSEGLQKDTAYSYSIDGNINSITPYDGKGRAHGKHYSYFSDNTIENVGEYKKGKRVGEWLDYYRNGQLSKFRKYDKNGDLIHVQTYYRNGGKNIEKNLKERVYVGKYERFYDDGQLVFSYNYKSGYKRGKQKGFIHRDYAIAYSINKKGQTHGKYMQFDLDTGVLLVNGKFNNGVLDSKWEYFTADGLVFRREEYKKGVRVSITNTPHYDSKNGVHYDEQFEYGVLEENPNPKEEVEIEEEPFFLFSE